MTGRLRLDWHDGALHIYRGADPGCVVCAGRGGWLAVHEAAELVETVLCHCWSPDSGLRIRLLPRRHVRAPF